MRIKHIPPRKTTVGLAGRGMASSSPSAKCARSGAFDDDGGSAGFIGSSKARQHRQMPTGRKRSITHLEPPNGTSSAEEKFQKPRAVCPTPQYSPFDMGTRSVRTAEATAIPNPF